MTQSIPEIQLYNIDQFCDFYPENSINRYELFRAYATGIFFYCFAQRRKGAKSVYSVSQAMSHT
jgi:hypothetical protein